MPAYVLPLSKPHGGYRGVESIGNQHHARRQNMTREKNSTCPSKMTTGPKAAQPHFDELRGKRRRRKPQCLEAPEAECDCSRAVQVTILVVLVVVLGRVIGGSSERVGPGIARRRWIRTASTERPSGLDDAKGCRRISQVSAMVEAAGYCSGRMSRSVLRLLSRCRFEFIRDHHLHRFPRSHKVLSGIIEKFTGSRITWPASASGISQRKTDIEDEEKIALVVVRRSGPQINQAKLLKRAGWLTSSASASP